MFDRTPSAVDVTVGEETRIYEAFVTTAPVTLDRPSTVTLEESSFARVAHFAAEPITLTPRSAEGPRGSPFNQRRRAPLRTAPQCRPSQRRCCTTHTHTHPIPSRAR